MIQTAEGRRAETGRMGKGCVCSEGVLDGGFGEGHSQMVVFSQVVVVEVDKSLDGLFHRTQLDQCHLTVLLEKLEGLDCVSRTGKQIFQKIISGGGRDI